VVNIFKANDFIFTTPSIKQKMPQKNLIIFDACFFFYFEISTAFAKLVLEEGEIIKTTQRHIKLFVAICSLREGGL